MRLIYSFGKFGLYLLPSFDIGFREFPLDKFGLTQEYENIWVE